jgi:uncharacterized alkaline shock family protein YloU
MKKSEESSGFGEIMTNYTEVTGKTTISPEVLVSIAKLTSLDVTGVSHLTAPLGNIGHFIRASASDGVKIVVEEETVYIDLFVVLKRDINIREVSHTIQSRVTRAIQEMVGMEVGRVNIHVEDIDYSHP